MNWRIITGELRGAKAVESNTLPEAVYRLYSYYPSYPQFGSGGWVEGQPPKHYASLEDVHGKLHVFVGGSGQMGTIAVAAFDPIFWSVILLPLHYRWLTYLFQDASCVSKSDRDFTANAD